MAIALSPTLNRKVATAVNLLSRTDNNTGEFQLSRNSFTTTVADARVWENAVVFVKPQSAAAAAVTGLWVQEGDGFFTVHHAKVTTDMTFKFAIQGVIV